MNRAAVLGRRGLYPRSPHAIGTRGLWFPATTDEAPPIVIDDSLVSLIYTMVDEFGKSIIFYEDETYTYDKSTLEGVAYEREWTRKITPPENFGKVYRPGTLVNEQGMTFYLPALGLPFTPFLGQVVLIDGERWTAIYLEYLFATADIGAYKYRVER